MSGLSKEAGHFLFMVTLCFFRIVYERLKGTVPRFFANHHIDGGKYAHVKNS